MGKLQTIGAVKGIIHVPAHNTPMKPSRRHALLTAIATARQRVDELAHGRAATLAVIARREGIIERHVRLLLALAFVSPRILSALLDGTAPANPTVTTLARARPGPGPSRNGVICTDPCQHCSRNE